MRRYWLDRIEFIDDELIIQGDLRHHLVDVCRQGAGDQFELRTVGRSILVEVLKSDRRSIVVKRISETAQTPLERPKIKFVLSLPRLTKVDWIVEKLVELGVDSLLLSFSEFSFIRNAEDFPSAKMDRWNKLIRQAAQQSARFDLMSLLPPQPLNSILESINPNGEKLCLFLFEGQCKMTLREKLKAIPQNLQREIYVFVGSEGGFSRQEVERFQQLGIDPLTLGDQVLRVETACVALASILQYEFGG